MPRRRGASRTRRPRARPPAKPRRRSTSPRSPWPTSPSSPPRSWPGISTRRSSTPPPTPPLALLARCDEAELLAARDDVDGAIALLNDAIEKEPATDLANRLKLQVGACLLAKAEYPAAAEQFDAVAAEPKNPLAAEARYRAAEALMRGGDWAKAVERLLPFRDQQPFQQLPDLSERAVLRLGHAYAQGGRWEESKQTMETLANRFPQGAWADEARYAIGWARQNQKQFDPAVDAYQQVVKRTASEVAARAQFQIGLCRLEQKRPDEAATALLVIPFTYDYPELNALALCEAARILADAKQPERAIALLERVAKDYPAGKHADAARDRLAALRAAAETK